MLGRVEWVSERNRMRSRGRVPGRSSGECLGDEIDRWNVGSCLTPRSSHDISVSHRSHPAPKLRDTCVRRSVAAVGPSLLVSVNPVVLLLTPVIRCCFGWGLLPKGLRPFGIPGSASGWDRGDGHSVGVGTVGRGSWRPHVARSGPGDNNSE